MRRLRSPTGVRDTSDRVNLRCYEAVIIMKIKSSPERRQALVVSPIAYAVMLACCGGAAANPVGPNVAAGAASFATAGKTLTVTNAPGTIINWQAFSIGTGELTRFNQQSASSAVLN